MLINLLATNVVDVVYDIFSHGSAAINTDWIKSWTQGCSEKELLARSYQACELSLWLNHSDMFQWLGRCYIPTCWVLVNILMFYRNEVIFGIFCYNLLVETLILFGIIANYFVRRVLSSVSSVLTGKAKHRLYMWNVYGHCSGAECWHKTPVQFMFCVNCSFSTQTVR